MQIQIKMKKKIYSACWDSVLSGSGLIRTKWELEPNSIFFILFRAERKREGEILLKIVIDFPCDFSAECNREESQIYRFIDSQ